MTRSSTIPWQAKYVALAVIWGSSFLLMKVALSALAPLQISAFRIYSGALVLLILLKVTHAKLPRDARTWGHLAFSSAFLTVLPFIGFVVGETRVSSALAGIGNAFTPISAVIFGLLLLPQDRLTGRRLLAVMAGFVGVVVIAEPWSSTSGPDLVGFGIVLAAAACYGIGWSWQRRFLHHADLGGLAQPTAVLLAGSVLMTPVLLTWWWLHHDVAATPWSLTPGVHGEHPVWLAVVCVLVLGIVGTGLAYMLQFDVVRAAGVVVSTTVTYLIPVVSVLLGVLVLGEHLGTFQILGFAVVLVAAWVINAKPRAAVE